MNKKYIYTDGKVTVISDNRETRLEPYSDNINDVLIKENVIEILNEEINDMEQKEKQYKRDKANKLFCLLPLLGGVILPLIGPLLSVSLLENQSVVSLVMDSTYSDYILSLISMVFPLGVSIGAIISIMAYFQYRKEMRAAMGVNSALYYLKNQIGIEKDELKILEENKKRENENVETKIIKVNDVETLKKIKNELEQYYELGYNINRYYRYYTQGNLESKLPGNIDVTLAQEYIHQKKLVKKK